MKLMWYCCSWIARRDMEYLLQNFMVLYWSYKLHLLSFCIHFFRRPFRPLAITKLRFWHFSFYFMVTYHVTTITIHSIHFVFIAEAVVGWFDSAFVSLIKLRGVNRDHLSWDTASDIWFKVGYIKKNKKTLVLLLLICSCRLGKTGANDTLTIFSYYCKWCCFLLYNCCPFTQSYSMCIHV